MAQFRDLPNELVDMIFEKVKDPQKLFPFLLSRQWHQSALLAMYKHIRVDSNKSFALFTALCKFCKSHAKRTKFLRVDIAEDVLPVAEEPVRVLEISDSDMAMADKWKSFRTDFMISLFFMLAPDVETFEIWNLADSVCSFDIGPSLKRLAITQRVTPAAGQITELQRQDDDDGSDSEHAIVLDSKGPSNLHTLMVFTDRLTFSDLSMCATIKRLNLTLHNSTFWLHVDDDMYALDGAPDSLFSIWKQPLPFTRLEEFVVSCQDGDPTTGWLLSLQELLEKSKNTLVALTVLADSNCNMSEQPPELIDFSAYTALQYFRMGMKTNPRVTRSFGQHDDNRKKSVASIREFLLDNRAARHTPALRNVILSAKEELMDRLRESDHGTVPPPAKPEVERLFRKIAHSDGRVEWKAPNDYSRTVSILKELAFAPALVFMECFFGVHINVQKIRRVVDHEARIAAAREEMYM